MKPFLKWPGGKRWLLGHAGFQIPNPENRYIEPFLGSAAVFFHLKPSSAVLSDINPRLIEVYSEIKDNWSAVFEALVIYQRLHSRQFYFKERSQIHSTAALRAAQFIYLNRTCFNGIYRENLRGEFNVPPGSKTQVLLPDDNFQEIGQLLQNAQFRNCDFEETMRDARTGDVLFLDPPYTTAHNLNGFIKYNQRIFTWDDQVRLMEATKAAVRRGAKVILTNANHHSIRALYADMAIPQIIERPSVIAASARARRGTSEALFVFN